MSSIVNYLIQVDLYLTEVLSSHSYTANLIVTPASKLITELIIITFVFVLSYESIYWSGIYLNLWEYHAKDIFKEIPVHCAHVYVRLNLVSKDNMDKLQNYYNDKKKSKLSTLYWRELNKLGDEIFLLDKFVKYHFEFSPEDFEMNDEPEYGSTIHHLRTKILRLFNESEIYAKYNGDKFVDPSSVLVFNTKNDELTAKFDKKYLVHCNIETGNIVDCIIVV